LELIPPTRRPTWITDPRELQTATESSEVTALLTQLNPPLPLETSKGPGWAHFVLDYGPESALLWVVFMDVDGACWTVPNFEVRMSYNWTLGRRKPADAAPASPDAPVRFPRPA
jgi:hypothetical protein